MMRTTNRSSLAASACAAGQGLLLFLLGVPADAAEQKLEATKKAAAPPLATGTAHGAATAVATASPKSKELGAGSVAETVITATERLMLDSKGYEATFFGDVKVMDPRFSLNCQKLTAFLKRPAEGGKSPAEAPAEKKQVQAESPTPGGGVEKAVAEGEVVIVQDKLNDSGQIERSIGRAAKAVYDSVSGDITLSGWPQVEQKMNTVVATEERTVIILNNKGTMEVLGHSKSVLRNTKMEEGR